MNDAEDPLRAVRVGKLESLRARGIDPYPYHFARTDEAAELERHYAELAAGCFFLWMVGYAIYSYNYLAVPFLMLFVGGYFWAGFTTLWQEYQGKLAFDRQQELAARRAAA